MRRIIASLLLFFAISLVAPLTASAVTMQWSRVDDDGINLYLPDDNGLGAVPYAYNIGTYEVTNSQYVEFLNAKDPAGTNTLFLYNSYMSHSSFGGVTFTAGNGSGSKYGIIPERGNYPVTSATWYDAIRFANWLNNGQGNGDTETGAYTLGPLGGFGNPIAPPLTRNAGSQVWLPTEDEWYKAAYYDPSSNTYNLYPTSSNTAPSSSEANYNWGYDGRPSPVGVHSGTSPYGAFDMAGNVEEWNETFFDLTYYPYASRGIRGGEFYHGATFLQSSYQSYENAGTSYVALGFRLASAIPEPSTGVLAVIAGGMLWWCRLRDRRSNERKRFK